MLLCLRHRQQLCNLNKTSFDIVKTTNFAHTPLCSGMKLLIDTLGLKPGRRIPEFIRRCSGVDID